MAPASALGCTLQAFRVVDPVVSAKAGSDNTKLIDMPAELDGNPGRLYHSVSMRLIYFADNRYAVRCAVKELARSMSSPGEGCQEK